VTVVEAIAEVEGVSPRDLGYALYDYIGPGVLDNLSRDGGKSEWQLRFTVNNHTVTVDSDGSLTVDRNEFQWQSD
jgi:hypothetical protein